MAFVDVSSCTSLKSYAVMYKFVLRNISYVHEHLHTVFAYVLIPGVCFIVVNMLPVALSATPTLIHFELGATYFRGSLLSG